MHCVIGRLVAPCALFQYVRRGGYLVENSMLPTGTVFGYGVIECPGGVTTVAQIDQSLIDGTPEAVVRWRLVHRGDGLWTSVPWCR